MTYPRQHLAVLKGVFRSAYANDHVATLPTDAGGFAVRYGTKG